MRGISIQNLAFSYPDSDFALRVDALSVAPGSGFALLGPSGAGKTTLLRLMAGLLRPSAGEIKLDGKPLHVLGEHARRDLRLGQMGLVFQDFALLDYLTVEENILLPGRFSCRSGKLQDAVRARELAGRLEIGQHWQKLVRHLSQGERQRAAIVRALAHQPRFLFADEPTASLDATRRGVVMDLLMEYTRENAACLVMVTHDTELMPLFPHHARVEEFTS